MKTLKITSSMIAASALMGLVAPVFAGGSTVNVTAKEWAITADKTSIPAGKVTFKVTNTGKDDHEVEVVKIDDKKFNDLPRGPHASVDEKWLVPASLGEVEDIAPGTSKSFTVDLKPGNYALLCNVVEKEKDGTMEAHYPMGMSAQLTVK